MNTWQLAAVALVVAVPSRVDAAFEESGFSARAIGMGSAFTAVHDDLSSIEYNPASLGQLRNHQVGVNYLRQLYIPAGPADLDQISLAGAFPLRRELANGTFGFAWVYTDHESYALDRVFHFSYGTRGFVEWEDSQLNMGASVKFLTRTLRSGGGELTPSFDVGFLHRAGDRLSFGLSFLNVNGPKTSGDRVPFTFKVGAAETSRNFVWAVDFTKREPSATHRPSSSLGGGVEYWTSTARWGSFAVRTGLSLGDRLRAWNAGLGWRIFGAQFDYAMTIPFNDPSPDLNHGLSLLFRFGEPAPERQYEKLLREEARIREDLNRALEAGEIKRWKFEAELEEQRRQIEDLSRQVSEKSSSVGELKAGLKELGDRHQKAVDSYQKFKKAVERSPQDKFNDEWAVYEALKAGGAPQAVLVERVRLLLRQYKDTGADLGPASQELLRLLRSR
ncbi:MAG: hypothetical protein HY748_12600 [Elusimicrobia bacterium]|nr:hypothetical protein [Elusimicrobiota bacterium]